MSDELEMVLVGGEWRAVGCVSAEELEEMERAHDAGDARMDARLQLLRKGRPEPVQLFFDSRIPPAPPPGSWSNDLRPPPRRIGR